MTKLTRYGVEITSFKFLVQQNQDYHQEIHLQIWFSNQIVVEEPDLDSKTVRLQFQLIIQCKF